MILQNDNIGLVVGTFFGSVFGSVATYFIMKKLGKLEHKRDLEEEQKHIDEVYKFYNDKLKELENMKEDVEKVCEETKKEISESNEKITEIEKKRPIKMEITEVDEDELSAKNLKVNATNYHKIYNEMHEKYENLSKEYEREELEEEPKYPEQITKEMFEEEIAYRKEKLIYYEQSGIFATLDDIVMNDYYDEAYFGIDNTAKFGTKEASLDGKNSMFELYLRNRVEGVDFFIIYNGKDEFNAK